MKAILLAAGYGSRLRALTKKTPKCLLEIQGTPLLEIWLDRLSKQGVSDFLINTHYLDDQVRSFRERYLQKKKHLRIELRHEEVLLGTAGTVWANQDFVARDNCIVINADNVSDISVSEMFQLHEKSDGLATLAYFEKENPAGCGLLEIGQQSIVTRFEEKPEKPFSHLAYAGIQVINGEIFDFLPFEEKRKNNFSGLDFGYDIFPRLVGKMYGYKLDCLLIDIGDITSYHLANKIWREFQV